MTSFKRTTYIFITLFLLGLASTFYAEAQRVRGRRSGRNVSSQVKTDSLGLDSLRLDSLSADSLSADSLPSDTMGKKDALDAPVIYEASDSIVFTKGGFAHLYGSGKVNYQSLRFRKGQLSEN